MESIPTLFKVVDLLRARLAAPGADPSGVLAVIEAHPQFAYFGSLGPSIADYLPPEAGAEGGLGVGNQYVKLWTLIYSLVGDDMRVAHGLFSVLRAMNDFLDKVVPIADAEDLDALKAMESEIDVINQTAADLKTIVEVIPDIVPLIGSGIGAGMQPRVNVPVGGAVPPAQTWEPRNFLHWSSTGEFANALVAAADASGDDRCRAFAYGWLASYSAKAGGSAFINSIVGGPYRLHWWRHRWVGNSVAAWVYGFYESGATMAGDVPTPGYQTWPNLCDAKLHEKLEFSPIDPQAVMQAIWKAQPLPDVLPPEIGECLLDAFRDVYGDPGPDSHFKAEALNGAYLLTWLQLWFQTSGEGIGCNPLPPLAPPAGCGGTPSWVDPNVPGDTGGGSTPPSPSIESDPDVGKIVSGILLALLGVAAIAATAVIPGAAAIAAGIDLIIDGATAIDWAKLRCDLYWYRLYLYNGLAALHNIMTLGGFAYPYAAELAVDSTTVQLLGIPFTFDSGKAITKSKPSDKYPASMWSGLISTWTQIPSGFEAPGTTAYLSQEYPSFFIDDAAANPLGNGLVGAGSTWPVELGGSGQPVQFGNAVDNALDLFANLGADLPSWNLDGDRGLAYFTWRFRVGIYTDPVDIEPE